MELEIVYIGSFLYHWHGVYIRLFKFEHERNIVMLTCVIIHDFVICTVYF